MSRPEPDFAALRAERDAGIRALAGAMYEKLGGDPADAPVFHCRDFGSPCYCACPEGPCEHDWTGWRDFDDDSGGEQVCSRCSEGAMTHSIRTGP